MESSSASHSEPAVAAGDRAKYKLLSPAKLPISRSPCITIPPGLSPTSFLESPVLLTNMKVEPSPTTGSLFKPQVVHGSVGPANYTSAAETSSIRTLNDKKPSSFESERSSAYNMVREEMDHNQSELVQTRGQYIPRSSAPSPSNLDSVAVSSGELSLSPPINVAASGTVSPAESSLDDSNQRDTPGTVVPASDPDQKAIGVCDDGYNWRKYGQKLVKGSVFPRSYYKCTHPNCEVKKIFERSHDGKIREIIYKGNHDHPKPQPGRRNSASTNIPNQSDKASSSVFRDDQMSQSIEPNTTTEQSTHAINNDTIDGVGLLSNRTHNEVDDNNDDDDDDDSLSKRRKMEHGGIDNDITPVVKPIREPRVIVQTVSEVDILDDGYRWRKYGQKVVRGNPNPRSYYKCTHPGCPVRKHVERASHDPKAVITTYEGKHNHDVPVARTTSHDTAGPVSLNEQSRMRSDDHDTVSLNLMVGVSPVTENRSHEQPPQALQPGPIQSQPPSSGSNYKVIQAPQILMYHGHGLLNTNTNQCGPSKNQDEGKGPEIPP